MSLIASDGASLKYMTHRDFAEMTGVRQDSVQRTMETMQERGELSFTQSVEMIPIGKGGQREAISLLVDERNSYILMAKLNPDFCALLADHWKQTKNAQPVVPQLPDFNNPVIAARAWADKEEARQLAQYQLDTANQELEIASQKLEEAEDAVYYAKQCADTKSLTNLRNLCKRLVMNERQFTNFLLQKKFCFRRETDNKIMPYKTHVLNGRFKILSSPHNGKMRDQMYFTEKGVVWIMGIVKRYSEENELNVPLLKLLPQGR